MRHADPVMSGSPIRMVALRVAFQEAPYRPEVGPVSAVPIQDVHVRPVLQLRIDLQQSLSLKGGALWQ